MKSINQEVIKEIISFIEGSSFYNKIQIITENNGQQTETFYFMKEEGIGHGILLQKESGEVETIKESAITDKNFIYERLASIEDGAVVNICGNSQDNILSIKL
jgi:hypothetical protein